MSHLSMSLRIEASAEAVFDLIADPARSPEWQTLLVEMGDIAGRPGGIGSSFVGFYRVAGRKLAGRFVVTAADRPAVFQVNGTTTGGWARWTTMLQPAGSACDVQVNLEYELPGEIVGSLFGMLTGNRMEREFHRTYENLKRLVETGTARVPGNVIRSPSPSSDGSTGVRGGVDDDAGEQGGRLATT
jgi:hypothetical protein